MEAIMLEEKMIHVGNEMFQKEVTFTEPKVTNKKALRADELYTATILVAGGTLEFDTNEVALDRMSRVLIAANVRFNSSIASGMSPSEAWGAVYQNYTIPWKLANNEFTMVPIATIAEAHFLGMQKMQSIWTKYG